MSQRSVDRRALLLVGVALLVGIGLVGVFLLALRAGPDVAQPIVAATAIPPSPPPAPVAQPASETAPVAALTDSSVANTDANLVALVNERPLDLAAAQRVQAFDQAMAAALGQTITTDDLMERLINAELVSQAAVAAAFLAPADEIDAAFTGFLSAQGITAATLAEAMAVYGLSLDDFRSYFAELITIDQFSRSQAAAQGITVDEYIDSLQQNARISFGPAATALTTAVAVAPSAVAGDAASEDESQAIATPAMSAVADTSAIEDLLGSVASADAAPNADARGISPGQLAPDFSLPALNSPDHPTLAHADLLGQPTVLSFWTTWCPYCRRQTPVLVAAAQRYADENIRFVGINVKESQEPVEAYLAEHGITFPIALDASGEIASRYQIRGFPTTYFLDAHGRVVAQHVGALTAERLQSYLQTLTALPD